MKARLFAVPYLALSAALVVFAFEMHRQSPALGAAATPGASQTATPITTPPSVTSVPATASVTSVPSTVPSATKTPDEPPPKPPPPPVPTPLLPEEGGPPGGVIGGHQFVDSNANGVRDSGDQAFPDSVIIDSLDANDQVQGAGFGAVANKEGYWQVRALPDGRYRVIWAPPIPADQFSRTIPPAETVPNGRLTVQAITRTVVISGANRVLDVDFGIPAQLPVAGANRTTARLPSTGQGGGGLGSAPFVLLAGSVVMSLLLAGGVAWSRRRAG